MPASRHIENRPGHEHSDDAASTRPGNKDKCMNDPRGVKLGYVWLQPGVTRLNGYTLLYVLFISIGLLVFLNFQQPYVLEVMLGIPEERHGRVVAQMALIHEL